MLYLKQFLILSVLTFTQLETSLDSKKLEPLKSKVDFSLPKKSLISLMPFYYFLNHKIEPITGPINLKGPSLVIQKETSIVTNYLHQLEPQDLVEFYEFKQSLILPRCFETKSEIVIPEHLSPELFLAYILHQELIKCFKNLKCLKDLTPLKFFKKNSDLIKHLGALSIYYVIKFISRSELTWFTSNYQDHLKIIKNLFDHVQSELKINEKRLNDLEFMISHDSKTLSAMQIGELSIMSFCESFAFGSTMDLKKEQLADYQADLILTEKKIALLKKTLQLLQNALIKNRSKSRMLVVDNLSDSIKMAVLQAMAMGFMGFVIKETWSYYNHDRYGVNAQDKNQTTQSSQTNSDSVTFPRYRQTISNFEKSSASSSERDATHMITDLADSIQSLNTEITQVAAQLKVLISPQHALELINSGNWDIFTLGTQMTILCDKKTTLTSRLYFLTREIEIFENYFSQIKDNPPSYFYGRD